ncbi:peptide-methionine (S)-S-oxide reductase MsrA [Lentilitoribacter sp. EG35]|uniref:peptide-methionine (S)-S-oxide reductase MsrA n=1 Tax=Lentilitoribacter sp. EG35 TaxID=3234192 RepID=UPI003461744A
MSLKSNSPHRLMRGILASAILAGVALSSQTAFAETKSAYFAGGCFWCIEKDFEHVKGVKEVESGYQGGTIENPTYRNHPDYIEAVRIDYDPSVVDYASLLKTFFRTVDPTDPGGQFCDRGHAYTTAIFTSDEAELEAANAAKLEAQDALSQPIATVIRDYSKFWLSEGYHQNYYKKNPVRYKYYRFRCGRNQTVKKLWGDQAYLGVDH